MIEDLTGIIVMTSLNIYHKYITINKKGETVFYVTFFNDLYRIMKPEILFYKDFVTTIGFKINPYDPCVIKKLVNGKKMTVVWHIGNFKVSHERKKIVTRMAKWLNKTYEIIFEDGSGNKNISRGNIHK